MNSWLFFSSHFAFFVFIYFPLSSSFDSYTNCSNAFNCGDITQVGFPFWGDGRPESCGYPELKLTCSNDVTAIEIMGVKYRLLKINQGDQTLKIVRDDYCDKVCSPKFGDTKLNSELFDYVIGSSDITLLYDCTSSSEVEDFSCPDDEAYEDVAAIPADVPESPMCKSKVVVRISDATGFRILSIQNATALEAVVREGFEVKYKVDSEKCGECVSSKGVCGYDWNLNETVCHCANQASESRTCSAATAEAIDNPAVVPPPAKGSPASLDTTTAQQFHSQLRSHCILAAFYHHCQAIAQPPSLLHCLCHPCWLPHCLTSSLHQLPHTIALPVILALIIEHSRRVQQVVRQLED